MSKKEEVKVALLLLFSEIELEIVSVFETRKGLACKVTKSVNNKSKFPAEYLSRFHLPPAVASTISISEGFASSLNFLYISPL